MKINLLYDQRVIPNYRVGVLNKLNNRDAINLTVSYWGNSFLDQTPNSFSNVTFNTVCFNPWKIKIKNKIYWFNFDLLKYIYKKHPHVILCPIGTFGIHPIFSFFIEGFCSVIFKVRFVYRTSGFFLPGRKPVKAPRGIKKLWHRIQFCNKVVTVYTERAAELVKLQGGNNVKIFVDYNSMDTDELLRIKEDLKSTEDVWKPELKDKLENNCSNYILFVGRLFEYRRVDILLNAWNIIKKQYRNWGLIIIGSGPAKLNLMTTYENTQVTFIEGIFDHRELAKYYLLSDIVVFPGCAGLSTHFAMCFGKPIICPQYGNEAEYVQDGINGFKYSYGNVDELADKISILITDDKLRKRFGTASEKMVKEKINVQHMVDTIREAIHYAVEVGR